MQLENHNGRNGTHPPASTPTPALVWGAWGFIGRHLVPALLESGAKVSVLTKNSRRYDLPWWAGEVTLHEMRDDQEADAEIFREAVSEAPRIFNLAGPSGAAASNADPFRNLEHLRCQIQFLEACAAARHCPHVVFTSSRLVYGRTGPQPVEEHHSLAPRSMYAVHKISAENYHRVFGLLKDISYTICRISNAYGHDVAIPANGCRVVNRFIKDSFEQKPITLFGGGGQLRDYIHVYDVVRALMISSTHPMARNQVFNIGHGEQISLYQAAEMIRTRTNGAPIRYLPWPNEFSLVESGDFVVNVNKAHELLGFSAGLSFAEGLDLTVEAYEKSQGSGSKLRREIALAAKAN